MVHKISWGKILDISIEINQGISPDVIHDTEPDTLSDIFCDNFPDIIFYVVLCV